MNMKTFLQLVFLSILSFATVAQAEVQTQEIDYTQNGTTLKGYIAYDDAIKGKRPGILVVHEWWGHNKHARNRARMLGGLDTPLWQWICMAMEKRRTTPKRQVNL